MLAHSVWQCGHPQRLLTSLVTVASPAARCDRLKGRALNLVKGMGSVARVAAHPLKLLHRALVGAAGGSPVRVGDLQHMLALGCAPLWFKLAPCTCAPASGVYPPMTLPKKASRLGNFMRVHSLPALQLGPGSAGTPLVHPGRSNKQLVARQLRREALHLCPQQAVCLGNLLAGLQAALQHQHRLAQALVRLLADLLGRRADQVAAIVRVALCIGADSSHV